MFKYNLTNLLCAVAFVLLVGDHLKVSAMLANPEILPAYPSFAPIGQEPMYNEPLVEGIDPVVGAYHLLKLEVHNPVLQFPQLPNHGNAILQQNLNVNNAKSFGDNLAAQRAINQANFQAAQAAFKAHTWPEVNTLMFINH